MDEEGGEPRGAIKPQLERACRGVSRLQEFTLRGWTVSLGSRSRAARPGRRPCTQERQDQASGA